MTETGDGDDRIGYRRPPRGTRFRKGRSGNPRGRPKGRRDELPYEAVLGQIATIIDGGTECRVTAEEAFLLYMVKQGLEGNTGSTRAAMTAIEQAKFCASVGSAPPITTLVTVMVDPGSVTPALEPLRMARKFDRYRETSRMMLEPWLVEMALARLGDRHLTIEQQREVLRVTRAPQKVRWPDWWEAQAHGRSGHRGRESCGSERPSTGRPR